MSEIEFALKLNYKILQIHECHIYQSRDYILKDFVKTLNFFKTKHSDCLRECKTFEEKVRYCHMLNIEMDLSDPFVLSPNNIAPNKQKRNLFKLMANGLFGKLEQKNDKSQTLFVNKKSDLADILASENKIKDIFCINDEICEVQIIRNVLKIPPNRKSNCYIGAQVTAYARQTIYSHLQTLLFWKATIYQVDCDSIIFTLDTNLSIPLHLSDAVGHFKHEVDGEIKSFYSLGPKNYNMTFEKDGCLETISKVRGLSLNNSLNNSIFTDHQFQFYVDQFVKGKRQKMAVNQFRKKANYKKLTIKSSLEQITFSNDLTRNCITQTNTLNYSSHPFGYIS